MRKILFASERVNSNSHETFLFIGMLVVFALLASAVVLYEGLKDDTRNRFKLILHCIMIITSVVPPELPMELSLAVTHSLAALSKVHVYCTEPFRIPIAGRLTTLCFDKTGTLTQDKMQFRGIINAPSISSLTDPHPTVSQNTASTAAVVSIDSDMSKVPALSLAVMGSCHALFRDPRTGNIVG